MNFYTLLGITKSATKEQIKTAFRKKAQEYHPDHRGPEFSDLFMQISQAYQTLSDDNKRKQSTEE